jgi:hypothetical protein
MAERFQVTPNVRADFIRVAGNVYDRASYATRARQTSVPAASAVYRQSKPVDNWQNREPRVNEGAFIDRSHRMRQYGSQPPVYQIGDRAVRGGYINR